MDFDNAKRLVTFIFAGFAVLELVRGRFWFREQTSRKDLILDVAGTTVLPVLVVPLIFTLASALAEGIVPDSAGMLAWLPSGVMFGLLLLVDDLTQYGWHRLSHSSWLYPLHRAHHSAGYLSVRVVYRNHLIYYLFMPGLWLSGVAIYWGFGGVYAVYVVLKMTVIIGAHSSVAWDAPLYDRFPRLMWVVERLISTPATHSAHHGLHESDGITHYKGNYGNFLFLWDVLFGTAHITRKRPETFGIEGLEHVTWVQELLVPTAARRKSCAAARSSEPL